MAMNTSLMVAVKEMTGGSHLSWGEKKNGPLVDRLTGGDGKSARAERARVDGLGGWLLRWGLVGFGPVGLGWHFFCFKTLF